MSAGPASTSAAPPPRSGPGAPQGRRFLGMSPTTITIIAVGALLIGGVWLYRRRASSASSAAAPTPDQSAASDTLGAADTGTLQTELADLQGASAQDTASDSSSSSQQAAQIEQLQDQIANLQATDKREDRTRPAGRRAGNPGTGSGPTQQLPGGGNPTGQPGPIQPGPRPRPPVRRQPPAHVNRHHHTRSR